MKRHILTVLFAVFVGVCSTYAQREMSREHPERSRTERADHFEKMKEDLNLTPKQAEEIRNIIETNRREMQVLRSDGEVTEAEKEKMRVMKKTTNDRVMSVLNEEQKEKYKAMRKEKHSENRLQKADAPRK